MIELSELSTKKLNFKKTKENSEGYVKNYAIISKDNTRVKVSLKKIQIPFGYEDFNGRKILNIEINPKKNNDHHNIKSLIKEFENEFVDQKNIYNTELKEDIMGKGYYNNMRSSKGGYIIRCFVFGSPEIYSNVGNFKSLMTSKDIVKTVSNVEIELGTLWITENNYGFSWYIKKIEILYGL